MIEVARRLPPSSIKQVLYPVEKHLKTTLLLHLLKGATRYEQRARLYGNEGGGGYFDGRLRRPGWRSR